VFDLDRKVPGPSTSARLDAMSEVCEDNSDAPAVHFDKGEDLEVVVSDDAVQLSHHRTTKGADAVRLGYGSKATISKTALHYR
jgi:hypothetical protein